MTAGAAEHPAAGAELLEAAAHYENLATGLGHELFAMVAEAVREIEARPGIWPPLSGVDGPVTVRTRSTRKFPYRVIFAFHEGQIVILAYAHERQRPGYWRSRLEDVPEP